MRLPCDCRFQIAVRPGFMLWAIAPAIALPLLAATAARAQFNSASGQPNVVYVNSSGGSDAYGNGTERAPFQTITKALQVAPPNTVILLAPGTYSANSGEIFPLQLKPGVTVQGNLNNRGQNVAIAGGGWFCQGTTNQKSQCQGELYNTALVGADVAGLMGVTVTNPYNKGYGLIVNAGLPVIANNTFTSNAQAGIAALGNSAPSIRQNYFYQNGSGIAITGTSQAELQENILENTGTAISISDRATPKLIGNRIFSNLDGVVISANTRPILRSNIIENNRQDGLVASAKSMPDLGSTGEPGGNIIRNNGRNDTSTATIASSAANPRSTAVKSTEPAASVLYFGQALPARSPAATSNNYSQAVNSAAQVIPNIVANVPPAAPNIATSNIPNIAANVSPAAPNIATSNIPNIAANVSPSAPNIATSNIPNIGTNMPPANPATLPSNYAVVNNIQSQSGIPANLGVPTMQSNFVVSSSKPQNGIPANLGTPEIQSNFVVSSTKPQNGIPNNLSKPDIQSNFVVSNSIPRPGVPANTNNMPQVQSNAAANSSPQPANISPAAVNAPPAQAANSNANNSYKPANIPIPFEEMAATRSQPNPVPNPLLIESPKPPANNSNPTNSVASFEQMAARSQPVPAANPLPAANTSNPTNSVASFEQMAARSQPIPAANPVPRESNAGSAINNLQPEATKPAIAQPAPRETAPIPLPAPSSRNGKRSVLVPVNLPEISSQPPANSTPVEISPAPINPNANSVPNRRLSNLPPLEPGAIEIPVQMPANNSELPPITIDRSANNSSNLPQTSRSAFVQPPPPPSANLLPVPNANIPIGKVDKNNRNNSSNTASAAGLRFRVVVDAESTGEQELLRSLVPNAFSVMLRGKAAWQVGAYSDRANAQEMVQALSDRGLKATIEPMN